MMIHQVSFDKDSKTMSCMTEGEVALLCNLSGRQTAICGQCGEYVLRNRKC